MEIGSHFKCICHAIDNVVSRLLPHQHMPLVSSDKHQSQLYLPTHPVTATIISRHFDTPLALPHLLCSPISSDHLSYPLLSSRICSALLLFTLLLSFLYASFSEISWVVSSVVWCQAERIIAKLFEQVCLLCTSVIGCPWSFFRPIKLHHSHSLTTQPK